MSNLFRVTVDEIDAASLQSTGEPQIFVGGAGEVAAKVRKFAAKISPAQKRNVSAE